MGNLAKEFYLDTQVGGSQDKLAWTAYPHPYNLAYRTICQRKQLNLT